jgi:arylsulfatase A-like enzyme
MKLNAVSTEDMNPNDRPPNILLILVDDVGYCDVGAFAARVKNTTTDRLFYETPQIDRLAQQGLMFTDFYACSVCAPSRASLMTGKMNNRMGLWDAYAKVNTTFEATGDPVPDGCHILDHKPWDEYGYSKTDRGVTIPLSATCLHDNEKTIPDGLQGYHSAFIGKWHLGSHNHVDYQPMDRGFDEVLAYYDGGGSGYYRQFDETGNPLPFRASSSKTGYWDDPGPDLTPRQDYVSDDVAQRVNLFLADRAKHHAGEPFFLYVSHPACHSPIEPRKDDLAYFEEKAKTPGYVGPLDPAYAGLLKGMDRSIGAILDQLDALNLAEDTVVIFISDNGGHPVYTSNSPLRGGKSMEYEGGIRVPMIVRWPGRTTPGSVCNVTSDIADIYPTVMQIAGIDYSAFSANPATDGHSLVPLFADVTNANGTYGRDEFYQFYGKMGYTGFHHFATWACLRKGAFKLHYDYHGKVELYNIDEDVREEHDLVRERPKLALEMLVQLTDWLNDNCNEAYLPEPNPDFDPNGPLPYGPYVPLEKLKASLKAMAGADRIKPPTATE